MMGHPLIGQRGRRNAANCIFDGLGELLMLHTSLFHFKLGGVQTTAPDE
jgi:hypothetical protein